jgi:hypothetical protein
MPRPVIPRNVLADVSVSLRSFDVTPDCTFSLGVGARTGKTRRMLRLARKTKAAGD